MVGRVLVVWWAFRLGGRFACEIRYGYGRLLSSWSSILCRLGVSITSVTPLFRAIIQGWAWPPDLDITYHFLCYFRYIVNRLKAAAANVGIDVSATLQQCDIIVEAVTALTEKVSDSDSASTPAPDGTFGLNATETQAVKEVSDRNLVRGRSFCLTDRGRICNAMHEVQAGDAIVALAGARTLFVLRPVGDQYRLIGDAYVDGLMLGEAYEGLDPNEVDYDIELV
jgi:hypothetical protein